jgi:hypothetical protein
MTGTIATLGDCATTTEPAAAQKGQVCELVGSDVRSAQKWNCAARNTIPRSSAKIRIRDVLQGMYLLRRSLGKNGCGVKQRLPVEVPPKQPTQAFVRLSWYA